MKKNNCYKGIGNKNTGFSLVEILISIAIISLLTVTISTFQKDVFSLNTTLQSSLNGQIEATHITKVMVAELRESAPSSVGAYPIALASPTAITFYSDTNNDNLKERIRYFLDGSAVKKGVTVPSGDPLTYNSSNEKISTIISDFVASSTLPLFQYYSSDYTGTSEPLSEPVDIPSIRLVKITLIIEKDINRSPVPLITSSQVTLRNLKDNL